MAPHPAGQALRQPGRKHLGLTCPGGSRNELVGGETFGSKVQLRPRTPEETEETRLCPLPPTPAAGLARAPSVLGRLAHISLRFRRRGVLPCFHVKGAPCPGPPRVTSDHAARPQASQSAGGQAGPTVQTRPRHAHSTAGSRRSPAQHPECGCPSALLDGREPPAIWGAEAGRPAPSPAAPRPAPPVAPACLWLT